MSINKKKFVKGLTIGAFLSLLTGITAKAFGAANFGDNVNFRIRPAKNKLPRITGASISTLSLGHLQMFLDLVITNPTSNTVKLKHPYMEIIENNVSIANSVPKNKYYNIKPNAVNYIPNIEINLPLNLVFRGMKFSDIMNIIRSKGDGDDKDENIAKNLMTYLKSTLNKRRFVVRTTVVVNGITAKFNEPYQPNL